MNNLENVYLYYILLFIFLFAVTCTAARVACGLWHFDIQQLITEIKYSLIILVAYIQTHIPNNTGNEIGCDAM